MSSSRTRRVTAVVLAAALVAAVPLTASTILAQAPNDVGLDTTFGTDGKAVTNISTNSIDEARAMAVQSDGKIVVAGNA